MNYARVVGKVIERHDKYNGLLYTVRTRRRGKKEAYDDIYVALTESYDIEINGVYEFIGKLGIVNQPPKISQDETCVYADVVYLPEDGAKWMNEVQIIGTVAEIYQNKKVPDKISLRLDAEDGSYNAYKVVAWNSRARYITEKKVGERLDVWGELVSYFHRVGKQSINAIEIVFLYEENRK